MGSGLTDLTPDNRGTDFPLAWSPDGQKIAFESCGRAAAPNGGVFVMNADGSDPHVVLDGLGRSVSFSPDGSELAISSDTNDGGGGFYVVNADGSDSSNPQLRVPDALAGVDGRISLTKWSPDDS